MRNAEYWASRTVDGFLDMNREQLIEYFTDMYPCETDKAEWVADWGDQTDEQLCDMAIAHAFENPDEPDPDAGRD